MQEGYGVSLAFSCLLDVVRSISLIIANNTQPVTDEKNKENQVKRFSRPKFSVG
jgi:hypothetical protein